MKNFKSHAGLKQTLFTFIVLATVLSAVPSQAHEYELAHQPREAHTGFFLGIGAGVGGSMFAYDDGSRTISEDAVLGGFGSLRAGYAFSTKFSLSLEGYGFGSGCDDHDDDEWGLGASILAFTWHPSGDGFYVRTGWGEAGGHFIHSVTEEKVSLKDRDAFLFSLGYDWKLNERLTLGVAVDGLAIDAGTTEDFDDDFVGTGGISVQLNWFL